MNILLAVTGSISAYKAYDICRNYIKSGHQVKIILTSGALKFIKADTFNYLGASSVYTASDDFNIEKKMTNVLHIDLSNWLDTLVIAPASANTIAKLANGLCDDLLSSVFLTSEKKNKIIFPAMNTQMYLNSITQKNIERLNSLHNIFIHPPTVGELACGETGIGKLPAPHIISEFTESYPINISKRVILITTGSTIAPIDPVRYITNPSSGKTGYQLAKAYLKRGCQVKLIYGSQSSFPVEAIINHPNLELYAVTTTNEMYNKVQEHFPICDVFISSAAVSDIEVERKDNKIKKVESNTHIDFKWAPDILASMIKQKSSNQKIVSFAAETNNLETNFSNKWKSKPTDLMSGNKVHNGFNQESIGFGKNENNYFFIKNGEIKENHHLSKNQLSQYIANFTENII